MNEDIIEIMEVGGTSAGYIESLSRCRRLLQDDAELSAKVNIAIHLELDLAILDAEKAKSERLKANKDNLKAIKS